MLACFHADTLIALAAPVLDKNTNKSVFKYISLGNLYLATNEGKELCTVWSLNLHTNIFEAKLARVICTGIKEMDHLRFSNKGQVVATPDHQFLFQMNLNPQGTQVYYEYRANSENTNMFQTIVPFNEEFGCTVAARQPVGTFPAFTLQVEETNNYVVVTKTQNELYSGIVVKS